MAKQKNDTRLYQVIAEKLADAISAGNYKVGSRLPAERKLAEEFDVSRTTVREAVIALEIAGYVEVRGGSGVFITNSSGGVSGSNEDISALDVLEARILFEGDAAAFAAKYITDAEIAELDATIEAMIQESDGDSPEESADRRFHMIIAAAGKNTAITSTIEHLWKLRNNSPLPETIIERVRRSGAQSRIPAHREILAALKCRDSDLAREKMRAHLSTAVEQLLQAMQEQTVEEANIEHQKNLKRIKNLQD